MGHGDIGSNITMLSQFCDKSRKVFRCDFLDTVMTFDTKLIEPIAMDLRRTRVLGWVANDTRARDSHFCFLRLLFQHVRHCINGNQIAVHTQTANQSRGGKGGWTSSSPVEEEMIVLDDFGDLKLIEKPDSPMNRDTLPQTLQDCVGYLAAFPLLQPNVDQKDPKTIVTSKTAKRQLKGIASIRANTRGKRQ